MCFADKSHLEISYLVSTAVIFKLEFICTWDLQTLTKNVVRARLGGTPL